MLLDSCRLKEKWIKSLHQVTLSSRMCLFSFGLHQINKCLMLRSSKRKNALNNTFNNALSLMVFKIPDYWRCFKLLYVGLKGFTMLYNALTEFEGFLRHWETSGGFEGFWEDLISIQRLSVAFSGFERFWEDLRGIQRLQEETLRDFDRYSDSLWGFERLSVA